MPVLAACRTCTPLPMLSSRLLISFARLLRPCEVKKLVGLSRAELTLLPVARRFWVVESKSAVDCRESRFWRTDAERTIPDIFIPFWCEIRVTPYPQSFLIGRPAHPRSKFLRKNESKPESPGANFGTKYWLFATFLRNTTDTTAESNGGQKMTVWRLHRRLTIMRKDCDSTAREKVRTAGANRRHYASTSLQRLHARKTPTENS